MTSARRALGLMAYRAASDLAGKGAFFIVVLLAARRLTHEEFGVFSLGTTIGWIASVASDFGIQLHAARAIAQQPDRAGQLLRVWGRIRGATALLAALTIIVGLAIVELPPATTVTLFLLTLVYVASSLIEFLFYVCRGLGRTDIESTITLAQRAGTLGLSAAVLWWRADVRVLAAAMLVPMAIALIVTVSTVTGLTRSTASVRQAPLPLAGETASVFAIGAGTLLSALYFRIDVFLVELWRGTEAVALYNAVFRLVDALRLAPAAVIAVALPAIFQAADRRVSLRLAAALTAGAAIVAIAIIALAPRLIPLFYGQSFSEAVPAFQILMWSFPLMSLNYVLTHQLLGWHGHRAWAIGCAAALVFNVLLNARLIPASGIVGAAWTTFWTEAVITVAASVGLMMTTLPRANVDLPEPMAP